MKVRICITVCPCCKEKSKTVERRRLNTAYADEDHNYLTSCEYCYEDAYEYYADLWSTYYNEVYGSGVV